MIKLHVISFVKKKTDVVSFLRVGNVSSSPTQSPGKANGVHFFVCIKKSRRSASSKGASPRAAVITARLVDLGQVTAQRCLLCQLVLAAEQATPPCNILEHQPFARLPAPWARRWAGPAGPGRLWFRLGSWTCLRPACTQREVSASASGLTVGGQRGPLGHVPAIPRASLGLVT